MAHTPRPSNDQRLLPEFAPEQTDESLAAFDRRTFLRLMGASLAMSGLAGLEGCAKPQPAEKIVPYVTSPEGSLPGIPRFYATALPTGGWMAGYGRGVIVEQHEGRPTKIEGNPAHPASLGATDIFMQAAILQLYDPDRSTTPQRDDQPLTWGGILGDLRTFIGERGGADHLRVGLLTGTLTSPAALAQIQQLKKNFPNLSWCVHDALGQANARVGQRRALGQTVTPVFDLTRARRILSLDAHFLAEETGGTGAAVRYAREFASNRHPAFQTFGPPQTHRTPDNNPPIVFTENDMSRLYVAESTLTYTGAIADHRLPAKPAEITKIAETIARALTGKPAVDHGLSKESAAWAAAVAADLKTAGPASAILVGEYQPPEVHALAHAMHAALGCVGVTVRYLEPVEGSADDNHSLKTLVQAMDAGTIDLLIIMETNPAYTAPADIAFAQALTRFSHDPNHVALHVGGFRDETATLCRWHVPLSHPLEAWGDIRGHDGTISIIQPLIRPLWASKSCLEIFAALTALGLETSTAKDSQGSAADVFVEGYDIVRRYWMDQWKNLPSDAAEARWNAALRDGFMAGTASPPITPKLAPNMDALLSDIAALHQSAGNGIDIAFRPDPTLADGSWANHPWLQELPKPLTHLTWDTIAMLAPATARKLGIDDAAHESRETVPGLRVTANGNTVELPAWIQPGQPEDVITLYLGGGRRFGGALQSGVGVDVYPLRTTENPWSAGGEGVHIEKSATRFALACTQPQQTTEGRDILRHRPIADLPQRDANITSPDLYSTETRPGGRSVHLSLYDETRYSGYKWGMVVDLSSCIGCGACIIACQAENNIPTVGKEQVRRGREMHWIRIDTYYGDANASATALPATTPIHFQPMMCQHCENAPCELVCPVEATSHSAEGINEMTYNRCIGTRYCSNNCPYKVRRFNFFHYGQRDVLTWNMQKNPNVTVRSRGVMEKCNYCIQRVNRARIDAKREWARQETSHGPAVDMREPAVDAWVTAKPLPRLRVQTACQQACPTTAIIFGDLNDTQSLASILKTQHPWAQTDYGVLTELNTQPRTSYLERLSNPNPALVHSAARGST